MSFYLNMLTFAEAKVGKTTLMSTAVGDPRIMPMLIIDREGSHKAIAHENVSMLEWADNPDGKSAKTLRRVAVMSKAPRTLDKIVVAEPQSWAEIWHLVNHLFNKDGDGFKSIVIDTLSVILNLRLDEIVQEREALLGVAKNMLPGKPTQEDYGTIGRDGYQLVQRLNSLPMHTFLNAHVRIYDRPSIQPVAMRLQKDLPNDAEEKLSYQAFGAAFPGKMLAGSIPPLPDMMAFMEVRNGTDRVIRFTKHSQIDSGNRLKGNTLGDEMVNPTLPRIFDGIPALLAEKQ